MERQVERGRDGPGEWVAGFDTDEEWSAPTRAVADVFRDGDLEVLRLLQTAGTLRHPATQASGLRIFLPLEGRTMIRTEGEEVSVEVGEVAVARYEGPFSVTTESVGARIEVTLRRPPLQVATDGVVRTITGSVGRSILLSLVNATFNSDLTAESLAFPFVRSSLAQAASAILAEAVPRESAEATFARALALIAAMSSDTKVTVRDVTEGMDVSARTLQRVFADRGTTVHTEIRRARLAAAQSHLRQGGPTFERDHPLGDYVRSRRLRRDLGDAEIRSVAASSGPALPTAAERPDRRG